MPTVLESLNAALHTAMASDDRVILLGEDILDPYGGAFKITQGLSTKFPDRVFTTPVSESGIIGVAAGMALRGLRPVVEIMFGDFLALGADQIINHLSKFRYMYNEQVRVPLVIRTPMGGRRGYGPTHSQTLEKLFLGVPGLRVLAANALGDPGQLLRDAILEGDGPVLFVENKLLYNLPFPTDDQRGDFSIEYVPLAFLSGSGNRTEATPSNGYAQFMNVSIESAPPAQLTLAAYGYMAELGRQSMHRLAFEHEIFIEMVVPTQLSPFEIDPIANSAGRTGRLLVIEEGTYSMGWGAEVVARIAEGLGRRLNCAARIAAEESPIPASLPLEQAVLPGVADIIRAVHKMV
jgi:pyruvate/2-oxoglutarate/acetoin dehydrogenase E1 component